MRYGRYILVILSLTNALSAYEWSPWIQLELDAATTTELTKAETEFFLPLCNTTKEFIAFTFGRAALYKEDYIPETSCGLGLRKKCGKCAIGGINIAYDGIFSSNHNWFNFLDIGTELFFKNLDFRLDTRIPVGSKKLTYGAPHTIGTQIINSEVRLITQTASLDKSGVSIGGEVGLRFPLGWKKKCCAIGRVYAGGQWCTDPAPIYEKCATFGVEISNTELSQSKSGLQVTLGAGVCTNFQDRAGILSLTLRKGCKKSSSCKGLSLISHMESPIVRRLRPCVTSIEGELLNEALTTLEYDVNGIWVAYAGGFTANALGATSQNLQAQLNLAKQAGGSSTMVFADGSFSLDSLLLNDGQVLAGGNANLTVVSKVTKTPVTWGNWGKKTTNPLNVTSTNNNNFLLTMKSHTALDTASLTGGYSSLINDSNTSDIKVKNVTIHTTSSTTNRNAVGPLYGAIDIYEAKNVVIENVKIFGNDYYKAGIVVLDSKDIQVKNIVSDMTMGHGFVNNQNTTIDGLQSHDRGWVMPDPSSAAVNLINSENTVFKNFSIHAIDSTAIVASYKDNSEGTFSKNVQVSNGKITNGLYFGIIMGINEGTNTIDNVDISSTQDFFTGIQIGEFSVTTKKTSQNSNCTVQNSKIVAQGNFASGIYVSNYGNSIDKVGVMNTTICGSGKKGFGEVAFSLDTWGPPLKSITTIAVDVSLFEDMDDGVTIYAWDPQSIVNISGSHNKTKNIMGNECSISGSGIVNGHIEHDGVKCPK